MEGGIHTLHLANNIAQKKSIVINPYERSIVGDRSKLDGCYFISKDFTFDIVKEFLNTQGYKLTDVDFKNNLYYSIIRSK